MEELVIHGVRGTMPSCRPSCASYGGQTTCLSLETEEGLLILDAGSGLVDLGHRLGDRASLPPMALLFTHFHMDHVMGLPFFLPLYDPHAELSLYGGDTERASGPARIGCCIGEPFWPVELSDVKASLRIASLPSDPAGLSLFGVEVSWCALHHPQACLAYKLKTPSMTVVLATDHEPGCAGADEALAAFCHGADTLLCDAQFTPEELSERRGWGHGSWESAAELARCAGVGELLMTHHDPARADADIDGMVEHARSIFPNTRAAHQGMVLAGAASVR